MTDLDRRPRRTFAVISHPDAGKSTLTEALALHAQVIAEAGAVHGKAGRKGTVSDWMAMERTRGISVSSSASAVILDQGAVYVDRAAEEHVKHFDRKAIPAQTPLVAHVHGPEDAVAMTIRAEPEAKERSRCWCCDNEFPQEEVVHLGAHPEVALCFDCARWVRRRAVMRIDVGRRGMRVWLRRSLAQMRAAVIGRGWHDRAVIGPFLRRIERRLP